MFFVGVKDGKWCYISNGAETYFAEGDVRHYSQPPKLRTDRDGTKVIVPIGGDNRFFKLLISMDNLRDRCKREGVELRGKATGVEKIEKSFGPATVGGGIGALFGGPVGAAIGAGVAGWFSVNSDFETKHLEEVFNSAKQKFYEWERFDAEKLQIDATVATAFEEEAKKNWQRFYRLRSLSSVDELDGLEFEKAVALIYRGRGFKVEITKASGDFGVDILATKGQDTLAIQAKRYTGSVGVSSIQEVVSGAFFYKASKAIVITNSYFTPQAKVLADRLNVELINRNGLALMWAKVHPEDIIPKFDLFKYKEQEREIKRELGNADFAARTNKSRR